MESTPNTLKLRLPEALNAQVRELAATENVSLNVMLTTLIVQALASYGTPTINKGGA